MTHVSKTRVMVLVLLAALVATISYAVARPMMAEDAAAIGHIKDSYSFDVTDKAQLMDYGDEVFVGRIIAPEATDLDNGVTLWRVQVLANVKGAATGEVLVAQLGYVDEGGRVHESEDQPLLPVGRTHLLVTTGNPAEGALTLVAGPAASVNAPSRHRQSELVSEYTASAQ